ncbi:MAG: sigma-54 dependent transcriptional regulator [candidate division Zixibacteria bacterium]|nr:sigma-54 dependent transcriptional regulator [candidate division Zixibacteria bacterium]
MAKDKPKIVVIDDDPKVPWILSEGLEDFEIVGARDGVEGIQQVSKIKPNLVLLDIKMPGLSGLEVLQKLKAADGGLDVIMLSGHGETKNIVESIRHGASEFITKPFDVREVEIHIHNVLEKSRLKKEVSHLKSELIAKRQYDTFVGDSARMLEVKNIIEQVADSELSVVIRGESGTGKEIVARMIHSLSARRAEPFVKVNCAAIPRDLLEAELFGYEKGAFTGAHKTKPGRFEVANKGTMFLDEIGDMPMELQSKLLQVIEQHEFVRVGGIQNIHVDVRIVCATNKDMEAAIAQHQMRDDLFYRLNEVAILLPPLRERPEDIPLLVAHFLSRYNALYGKKFQSVSPDNMARMQGFHWPGNVRQLENVIKQVVVREDDGIIPSLLSAGSGMVSIPAYAAVSASSSAGSPAAGYALKKRVDDIVTREEKRVIAEVLQKTNWNRRKAADILEISYRSLLYKIKEYRINEPQL